MIIDKNQSGFTLPEHTSSTRSWNAGTYTETWTYVNKGVTVAIVTVVYDDAYMTNLVSYTKTTY